MQNFGILVNFRNKNINFKSPSITHKDDHFAKKTKQNNIKIEWKIKVKNFENFPLFGPFYIKNVNSYIITLCSFLKRFFPKKLI